MVTKKLKDQNNTDFNVHMNIFEKKRLMVEIFDKKGQKHVGFDIKI